MQSSIPPRSQVPKAVWGGVTAVLMALAALLTHWAQAPHAVPQAVQLPHAEPPVPPLGKPATTPTTDDGVIAARVLEGKLNPLIADLEARIIVLEARACIAERELRDANARIVKLSAGKHGVSARDSFEFNSQKWLACPLKLTDVQQRPSLSEAIGQQWR